MFPSFPSCMLNVAMTFALSGINLGKEPVLFRGAVARYLTFITQDYELGIRHVKHLLYPVKDANISQALICSASSEWRRE